MLTRQPVCETEIVPSLHSKRGGAISATGAGLATAAACWGAGAWATGLSNEAQPAQQTKSNKTRFIRICVGVRKPLQRADVVGRSAANPPARELLQHTTAARDSDMTERRLHGGLTGRGSLSREKAKGAKPAASAHANFTISLRIINALH
jgi:hypothetical protein